MSNQRRIELGNILKEILGTGNVYYQPSGATQLKYPCAIYNFEGYRTKQANNETYGYIRRYQVSFIGKDPDREYYDNMIEKFDYCSFDRRYIADNLYHDVYTVYY